MKTLNFCNHGLQICKEGVLFWLEKEIAIVSDLHLEKGSSYASSGQYIPPYDSEAVSYTHLTLPTTPYV